MARSIARLGDPYEIPSDLIPPGMIYQWVAKKSGNRIDPQYQKMIEAGWGEVPYKRLESHYQGRYRGEETEIQIGGQVLMERAKEMSVVARDKEIDLALQNAQVGRTAPVNLLQNVRLSREELAEAIAAKISSPEYISLKVMKMAQGADNSFIYGRDGSLQFLRPPMTRVCKYRWLNWLFRMISKETECNDV